jgi:hypothetical protein
MFDSWLFLKATGWLVLVSFVVMIVGQWYRRNKVPPDWPEGDYR